MIAIEGMGMPKDCFSCPFVGGVFGICKYPNYTRICGHRLPDCPLREVGKLAVSRIVDRQYSGGITWAKNDATHSMAEKLRADGCIEFELTRPQDDPDLSPLFYDPTGPGEVKVLALLTVVMPKERGRGDADGA